MEEKQLQNTPAAEMFFQAFMLLFRANDAMSVEEFKRSYAAFQEQYRKAFKLIDFEKLTDEWYRVIIAAHTRACREYQSPPCVEIENRRLNGLMRRALIRYGFRRWDKWNYVLYVKGAPAPMIKSIYVDRPKWDRSVYSRSRIDLCMWCCVDARYRTKVVDFVPHMFGRKAMYYVPVFEKETQAQWDEEEERWKAEGISSVAIPYDISCRGKFFNDLALGK